MVGAQVARTQRKCSNCNLVGGPYALVTHTKWYSDCIGLEGVVPRVMRTKEYHNCIFLNPLGQACNHPGVEPGEGRGPLYPDVKGSLIEIHHPLFETKSFLAATLKEEKPKKSQRLYFWTHSEEKLHSVSSPFRV